MWLIPRHLNQYSNFLEWRCILVWKRNPDLQLRVQLTHVSNSKFETSFQMFHRCYWVKSQSVKTKYRTWWYLLEMVFKKQWLWQNLYLREHISLASTCYDVIGLIEVADTFHKSTYWNPMIIPDTLYWIKSCIFLVKKQIFPGQIVMLFA